MIFKKFSLPFPFLIPEGFHLPLSQRQVFLGYPFLTNGPMGASLPFKKHCSNTAFFFVRVGLFLRPFPPPPQKTAVELGKDRTPSSPHRNSSLVLGVFLLDRGSFNPSSPRKRSHPLLVSKQFFPSLFPFPQTGRIPFDTATFHRKGAFFFSPRLSFSSLLRLVYLAHNKVNAGPLSPFRTGTSPFFIKGRENPPRL